MRPNGQALLGSRGIFETKPHRKAFPGGRQVQGKTRVRSIGMRVKPNRKAKRHQPNERSISVRVKPPENWLPSYDCQNEARPHPFDAAIDGLGHAADGLGPAEGLFDPFAVFQGEGIAIQFAEQPRNRNTAYSRQMRFDMIWDANGIEHRLTKPNHPWTNGQVEQMNRTIKEATVKRYHHDSHDQLRTHLADFMAAYNFARRLMRRL